MVSVSSYTFTAGISFLIILQNTQFATISASSCISLIIQFPQPPQLDTGLLVQLLLGMLGLAGWRTLDKINKVNSK